MRDGRAGSFWNPPRATVNAWRAAAAVQLLALVVCAVVSLRGDALGRLVGLETAGALVLLELVVIAKAFRRVAFYDVAIAFALLSFGGGLVFARLLERLI